MAGQGNAPMNSEPSIAIHLNRSTNLGLLIRVNPPEGHPQAMGA